MQYLFEELGIASDKQVRDIWHAINEFRPTNRDYGDSSPIHLRIDEGDYEDYEYGLNFLHEKKIINLLSVPRLGIQSVFISILNTYNLELLVKELVVLIHEPDLFRVERRAGLANIPNLAYYDPHSGKIIINGKNNLLRGNNKKIFDVLFATYPNYADRKTLLKIVSHSGNNSSSKIAINEAFSNLRSACGVNAKIITLNSEGGKLIANTYPLSSQLGRSDSQ